MAHASIAAEGRRKMRLADLVVYAGCGILLCSGLTIGGVIIYPYISQLLQN